MSLAGFGLRPPASRLAAPTSLSGPSNRPYAEVSVGCGDSFQLSLLHVHKRHKKAHPLESFFGVYEKQSHGGVLSRGGGGVLSIVAPFYLIVECLWFWVTFFVRRKNITLCTSLCFCLGGVCAFLCRLRLSCNPRVSRVALRSEGQNAAEGSKLWRHCVVLKRSRV